MQFSEISPFTTCINDQVFTTMWLKTINIPKKKKSSIVVNHPNNYTLQPLYSNLVQISSNIPEHSPFLYKTQGKKVSQKQRKLDMTKNKTTFQNTYHII